MAWNQSAGEAAKPTPKKPSALRGAVAGVVCAGLAAVVAFFVLSGKDVKPKAKAEKEPGLIKEVKPAAAPKVEPESEKPKKIPYWERETTNGLTAAQMRKWWVMHRPKPSWTNTTSLTEKPPKYAIFKHHSENEIALYLSLEPGETLVGTPVYGKPFERDFLKSLEEPIVVDENDSAEDAELKRAVRKAKVELKLRMDNGEKLGDILLATRKEYQDLANYKRSLETEVLSTLRGMDDVTDADVETTIAAANKMLEAKGAAPMKVSPMIRYGIMRRARVTKKALSGNVKKGNEK